jgi:8-oxo-dGTP diphosphatase
MDLPVETDRAFDDDADAGIAALRLRGLAEGGRSVVVCSQGKLIPNVLAVLSGRAASDFRTPKGTGWVLSFDDRSLVTIDELPA